MVDFPGFGHPALRLINECRATLTFRTHFVVMSWETSNETDTLFPYGYVDWTVRFHFSGWTADAGMTLNHSSVEVSPFQRSNVISRCAPSFAIDAVKLGSP